MRTLFITPSISWPPRNGGEIRKWNLLQAVLRCGETDVISFQQEDSPVAEQAYAGCRRVIGVSQQHLHLDERGRRLYQSTLGRGWLVLGTRLPIEYQGARRDELRATIRSQLDLDSYDLVWYATARMAFPLGRIPARHQILDGDDFSYVREWLLLRNSVSYGAKLWNYLDVLKLRYWEVRSMRHFDAVLRCSTEDQRRHPAQNVHVIPNGTVVPPTLARNPGRSALFVGELGYAPNEQGLMWFLDHVWPKVRERVPDAALEIAGRNPPAAIAARNGQDGVVVHGFVKDLDALYARASVSVVPLHAGGGTRLKVLEALARGTPVVATRLGAFGIPADVTEGLTRVDEPAAFANEVSAALSGDEARQQRALAGRELVSGRFDWSAIQDQVEHLVRSVVRA